MLTGAIAFLAGGGVLTAVRLAAAMLALQASIGALNDLMDREHDRRVKPTKPLVSGGVGRGVARAVVGLGLGVGLLLAAASGPGTVALAVVGVSAGYLYDIRLKQTAWGPLAFAVGVPILPVFAWLGAVGSVPDMFGALIAAAVLAGLGLAISNALADTHDDEAAGVVTVVTRLGAWPAWWAHFAALGATIAIAIVTVLAGGSRWPGSWLVAAGCTVVGLGVLAARPGAWRRRPSGWEIEAAGLGVLAAGWLLALAGSPG